MTSCTGEESKYEKVRREQVRIQGIRRTSKEGQVKKGQESRQMKIIR